MAEEKATLDRILLDAESHDQFLRKLMSSLVSSTKISNALPKGLDYSYNNSFQGFRKERDAVTEHSTQVIQKWLELCGSSNSLQMDENVADPFFYSQISDSIDVLLDRAERSLEDVQLERSGATAAIQQSLRLDKDRIMNETVLDIEKPQLHFLHDIDNSRANPFRPKLHRKFHSTIEYTPILRYYDDNDDCRPYYPNPYEHELQTLDYPQWLFEEIPESRLLPPNPLQSFQLIENETQLTTLIHELKQCKEIAIDLEHHALRSFQGLTCLMQISTRKQDFIIDTLSLRLSLWQLGEVFANPIIVKVLHGCERDVLWLQRDFGLYLINVFDTFCAATVLKLPSLSLAHLVRYYCGENLDKKHQLSDWRVRPLPQEMLVYAQRDTHFLLHIADLMRNELGLEGIEAALAMSKKFCMQSYCKESFQVHGYEALLSKGNSSKTHPSLNDLSTQQQVALSAIYAWRDEVARNEDESVTFIMSNSELLRIASRCPTDASSLEMCRPLTSFVRQHMSDVLQVVSKAMDGLTALSTTPVLATVTAAADIEPTPKRPAVPATSSDKFMTSMSFTPLTSTNSSLQLDNIIGMHQNQQQYHNRGMLSPILTLEEMFRRAGWKTPGPSTTDAAVLADDADNDAMDADNIKRGDDEGETLPAVTSCWSPLIFEAIKPQQQQSTRNSYASFDGHNNKNFMSQSLKDLYKSIESDENFQTRLRNLVKSAEEEEGNVAGEGHDDTAGDTGGAIDQDDAEQQPPQEIPRSYEEIYKLSGKNRKRNKDKKRQREAQDAVRELGADQEGAETFDLDPYLAAQIGSCSSAHQGNEADIAGVDSTLAFAKSVGWIQNEDEANALREDHQRVMLLHQQQHAGDDGHGSDSSHHLQQQQSDSPARRSFDKNSTTNQYRKNNSGGGGSKAAAQQSSPNRPAPLQAPPQGSKAVQQFDYSKVSQPAMGALPPVQKDDDQRRGGGGRQSSGGDRGGGRGDHGAGSWRGKGGGGGVRGSGSGSGKPPSNPYFGNK